MDGSAAAAAAADELSAAPESWEVADLDESVRKLKLSILPSSSSKEGSSTTGGGGAGLKKGKSWSSSSSLSEFVDDSVGSDAASAVISEEAFNQVDQFLREALHNPRERLSVLRIEQDVEKFVRDPKQQQLEFQKLPTSYLRLAAHRVAQHYSLQSMVMLDSTSPDGSGSRIIISKTSECRLPKIRLADIQVNLPSDGSGVVKVAIKQRPQKRSPALHSGGSNSTKNNSSKSMEERKEEYNKARARIFSSNSSCAGGGGKKDNDSKVRENIQQGSADIPRMEDKSSTGANDASLSRSFSDTFTGGSRSSRTEVEAEPVGRYRPNNRVAIFRDREIECNDPDFDRSYDRYMQRFDPGFGFNGRPYAMQPMHAPAVNYNTEFPQLGPVHRPHIPSEHQATPLNQHLHAPWAGATGVGYGHGHPEAMMATFGPNHLARSSSSIYPYSPQYLCQCPAIPFMHPQEQMQSYSQSNQQPDASFGFARPR